jgi:hypothetical protein
MTMIMTQTRGHEFVESTRRMPDGSRVLERSEISSVQPRRKDSLAN